MASSGTSAADRRRDSEDSENDEFFDCRENLDDETVSLAKWSSMELTPHGEGDEDVTAAMRVVALGPPSGPSSLAAPESRPGGQHHVSFRRVQSMREPSSSRPQLGPLIDVAEFGGDSSAVSAAACPTTVLILVAHGGSVLDLDVEGSVRRSDVATLKGATEAVLRAHYPAMVGHVVMKCVPCPAVCTEALALLSSLSPYR